VHHEGNNKNTKTSQCSASDGAAKNCYMFSADGRASEFLLSLKCPVTLERTFFEITSVEKETRRDVEQWHIAKIFRFEVEQMQTRGASANKRMCVNRPCDAKAN